MSVVCDERRLSRLQQVLAAARQIHSTLDLDTILATFLELSIRELDCEGGTIYVFDHDTGHLESRHVISPRPVDGICLKLGEGIAGRVAQSGEPAIVEDTALAEGFSSVVDERTGFHTVNTIAFPLADEQGRMIGVLQLVNKRDGDFAADDVELLRELSVFVALAIRNATAFRVALEKVRLDEELAVARRIQEMILPHERVVVPGFQLASAFAPCLETAGDYYHVFPEEGGAVVALMDVSGKGVAAAMVSFGIHAFLSVELGRGGELTEVARRLNEFLVADLGGEKYATGILLRVRAERRIEYVSGGHPPLLHRLHGEVRRLPSTALPFGLLPNAAYSSARLGLASGETLVLYSDGYTETVDEVEEEFGVERLVSAVAADPGDDPERLLASIHRELAAFQGGASVADDRSLLLLRAS